MRTPLHPWGDLSHGAFTDHFSHMNAARAFARIGADIWRYGPKGVFPAVEGEAWWRMPLDVRFGGSWTGGIYAVPGFRTDKPWVTSWSDRPRLYPPGDLLLVAPVALLYDRTDVTLADACRLLIMLFLVYTHIGLYTMFRLATREATLSTPVLWASLILIYIEAVHWTLEGFYDFAAAIPLIFCVKYLRERRSIAAALAYTMAAFLHFRVFFLAPLALYAVWIFIADKQWRRMTERRWLALSGVLLLSAVVLWVFRTLYPALITMPISNPAHRSFMAFTKVPAYWLLSVAAAVGLVFLLARAWLDVALLVWLTGMLFALREAQPWHLLILYVWLLVPAAGARPGAEETVRAGRLFMLAYVGLALLRNFIWPSWIPMLWAP